MSTSTPSPVPPAPAAFSAAHAPTLRAATAADLPAVERLLAATGLPAAGIAEVFTAAPADFVVADDPHAPGELAAVAGLEVRGRAALLRSVAVHPARRRHRLGERVVRRAVRRAEERGLSALYLLTMTAEDYFPRFGFARVERGAVPPEIAESVEFRSACPASAVAMARPLGGAPGRPPGRSARATASARSAGTRSTPVSTACGATS